MSFESLVELNYTLGKLVSEVERKEGTNLKSGTELWLARKKSHPDAMAVIESLEKNGVYLIESVLELNNATARFLVLGGPRIPAQAVDAYINNLKVPAVEKTELHLRYLRTNCAGCSAHDEHVRYARLRETRWERGRTAYLNELEFACRIAQLEHGVSGHVLAVLGQDSDVFASASKLNILAVTAAVGDNVRTVAHRLAGNLTFR